MDQALRQQIRTEEIRAHAHMTGAHAISPQAPQPVSPALELTGIHKHFGAFHALKNIELTVNRGEFVCFLGPSGCGKTTLLRIIAGLEPQTEGKIEIGGRDVSNLPPAAR